MKTNKLLVKAQNAYSKMALKVRKNSPIIFLGAGAILGVATVVVACKETMKVNDIKEQHEKKVEEVYSKWGKKAEDSLPKEMKKELTKVYVKTGSDIAKLYLPAIGLGALSMACIGLSYKTEHKRYLAISAALNATTAKFNEYRQNVIADQGEEADYKYGHTIISDGNNETDDIIKTTNDTYKTLGVSAYSKIFEEISSYNWQDSASANYLFLSKVQSNANDMLHSRGYLFLNEVYAMLGFRDKEKRILQTAAGQLVGWIDDEHHTKYVDFGFDKDPKFMRLEDTNVVLDFNVDGNILDILTSTKEIPII